MMRYFLLLPLALAACGEPAPDNRVRAPVPKNETATADTGTLYRCDDGSTVRVRFDRTSGGAEVTIGDAAPVTLPERYDSQGLVYTDDRNEVRMAGADVTVGPRGGPLRTCRVGGAN